MKILSEIRKAKADNRPFVAFRNPNENLVTLFVQATNELHEFKSFTQEGYVFAPFNDKEKAYLLKADFVFTDAMQDDYAIEEELVVKTDFIDDKERHIGLVEDTINTIKNTAISKIVVSRKEKVTLDNFDEVETFEKLLYQYPNAYGYIWFHPKVGLWMGATPETLLKVDGVQFKTMALAGTMPYKGTLNVAWGSKEIEEQRMVSDYIKVNLDTSVDALELSKVETVKAGNLLHLKTNVTGSLKTVKDVKKIVELLHPTPAVCGLPKEESKDFILAKENYDRSFYTGYLGVVNIHQKTSLFVNLRCFTLEDKNAYIYVGGGITENSIPEKEWQETLAKSKVMKKILKA